MAGAGIRRPLAHLESSTRRRRVDEYMKRRQASRASPLQARFEGAVEHAGSGTSISDGLFECFSSLVVETEPISSQVQTC